MAAQETTTDLDGDDRFRVDALGKLYISVATVWTVVLLCGVGFLLHNRHLPALRVRNTPLWISALVFLHAYWVLCWLAYVLNGNYPCSAEYWIMSLWLPFGVALYQVNGMHLLQIADLQTRFLDSKDQHVCDDSKLRKAGRKWRLSGIGLPDTLSPLQKIGILAGLLVQIVVTLIVFTLSRRFHPAWGVVGHAVDQEQCRRSWEWLPSILWQFIWSWIYAPYLLWKVRKIHDLHGWRLQTILCCLSGLPGTPMWLLALYSPHFSSGLAEVTKSFVPPLWFTPGIAAMEASIVLIPCIVVIRGRKLQKETLQQLAEWERNQKSGTSLSTGSTYVQSYDDRSGSYPARTSYPIRNELYSMKALDKALTTNINPLLRFSALKEFSGENISFLKHVQDWEANWSDTASRSPHSSRSILSKGLNKHAHQQSNLHDNNDPETLRHRQFALAVEIYVSFIDPQYAEFPVNISSQQLKELEFIFSHAASTLNVRVVEENSITPFEPLWDPDLEGGQTTTERTGTRDNTERDRDGISITSTATMSSSSSASFSSSQPSTPATLIQPVSTCLAELPPRLSIDFPVPSSFGAHVFDDAHRAVKYSVFTNTWPRFVKEGLAAGAVENGPRSATSRWSSDPEKGGYGKGIVISRDEIGDWARRSFRTVTTIRWR